MKKFRAFKEANIAEWGEMYVGKKIIAEAIKKGAPIVGDTVVLSTHQDTYDTGSIYCMNAIHWIPEERPPGALKYIQLRNRPQEAVAAKGSQGKCPGF